MSDLVPPAGPAREALRRLRDSIAAAAGLDEITMAFQAAVTALRPLDQPIPAGSRIRGAGQSSFAIVPQWPAHRWVTTPVSRIPSSATARSFPGVVSRQPVRTGELFLETPAVDYQDEEPDLEPVDATGDADGGPAQSQPLTSAAESPLEVETDPPPTIDATQAIERRTPPVRQYATESPSKTVPPLRPAIPELDENRERVARDETTAPVSPHNRWRSGTQLMTLLLAGEELGALLRAALRLSNQSFGVAGSLIHLRDNHGSLAERVFALGEPAFEAALRATVRQGVRDGDQTTEKASSESGETLSGRYPNRLMVPVQSASGALGEFCLFRSALPRFSAEEAEDARGFAALLAVVLEQKRLIRTQTRQREIMTIVRTLVERLAGATTPEATAEVGVQICAGAFGSGMASLHLYQEQSKRLAMAAAFGLPVPFVTGNAHLALGVGACGQAAQRRVLVVVEDVAADPDWMSAWHVTEKGFTLGSVWSLPLIGSDDHLLGTLAIYHARSGTAAEGDIALLKFIGHQIANALDRVRLVDRSQDLYRATVESLAAAVDAKDPFTHNHSWQVAAYCRKIAESLGLSSGEVETIELAGLLHDVGKIGIPDRVLQKSDELSSDEWAMMERHPDLGARILGDNPALAPVVPYVRHHHERFDGRGYPDRLSGNDIPLGAAIVGLADAFDTMTSDRPYRRARTIEQALEEVAHCSGSHFHPRVASTFLKVIKAEEIDSVARYAPKVTTRELTLKRDVGAEARGFGLLQRITIEIGAVLDVERFLYRLNELIGAEFPASLCEFYREDPNSGDLLSIATPHRGETIVIPRGQGILGWTAVHGIAQNVPDVLEDDRYRTSGHRLMRSLLAVPLVVDGHCAGVLSMENQDPAAFSSADQHVLEIVATYVAQAINVADLHERLKRHSEHDPLTGLLTHRAFCLRLDEEIERARLIDGKLAVAIFDIHELKAVNRTQGHAFGDEALKSIADLLKLKVRGGDTIGRYGGGEFALLVPRANGPLIRGRVGLIVDALAEERAKRSIPAISWGVACYPSDGATAAEIVAAAEAVARSAALKV